jgi:capsular polysaccharide biosynthesis protein
LFGQRFTASTLEQAAAAQGVAAPARHPEGAWTSRAHCLWRGKLIDYDVVFKGSAMRQAVLSDVSLVHAQYPISGPRLIYRGMHHNAEDQLAKLVDAEGRPTRLLRKSLGAARLKRPRRGLHALVGAETSSFWHFLYNFVLRLGAIEGSPDPEVREAAPLVIPEDTPQSFFEIFAALGYDPARFVRISRAERFEALHVSEMAYYVGPSLTLTAARQGAAFIRERLPPPSRTDRRLYLSRQDAKWRRVSNEAELGPVLSRYGFEPVLLSRISAAELVAMMGEAEAVIGPSGSNLGAQLFCRPGTAIVELSHEPAIRKYYFQGASSMGELRHFKLEGTAHVTPDSYVKWDFEIDPKSLVQLLEIAGVAERPRG